MGEATTITSVLIEDAPEGVVVYNLSVEADHTYFVEDGEGELSFAWVHNSGACDPFQNRINHIFHNRLHNHRLEELVALCGSEAKAVQALQAATTAHVRSRGLTGMFTETIELAGMRIAVQGNVLSPTDVRLNTAWLAIE